MILNTLDFESLKDKGFAIKRNVLNFKTISKIRFILEKNPEGKGVKENIYSIKFTSFLLNFLKLKIGKIIDSLYLIKLKNKLGLDTVSSIYFNDSVNLNQIDGYHNKKKIEDILPWHTDQAYGGKKNVKKINSPDYLYLKFFFYLTKVGPLNGCTSYIPGSHKITYVIRSLLFEKEINYQPFWSLSDLINLIEKKENFHKIESKLKSKLYLESFLSIAKKCLQKNNISEFDFSASPGDLLVFDEGGVHRGSSPSKNDRTVLRYLYKRKKINKLN